MIIVLAGTIEGREICSRLQEAGWPVLASVTSSWGTDLLQAQGFINTVQGNLSRDGLVALIGDTQANMVIDATHPFAATISREAMEATQQCDIDYLRLERPAAQIPLDPLVIRITELEAVENYLLDGQRVLSTLGSKSLADMVPIMSRKNTELTARVLPSSTVLKTCEGLGLRPNQIIAMQGPFSLKLNLEIFKQYRAEMIISKESGAPGGLEAKIGAALQMGIPILIWSRPQLNYPRLFASSQALMEYINDKGRDLS